MKRFLLVVMIGLWSSPVAAEVMDKEPTSVELWSLSATVATILFVLSLTTRSVAWVMIALGLWLAWEWTGEVRDPYVGPAILQEAGWTYVAHAYVTGAVMVAAPLTGNLFRIRRQRRRQLTEPLQPTPAAGLNAESDTARAAGAAERRR